ncbi:Stp1/IreP family PP2C-type Ser/Thr phosphatase [Anaerolineales bacterium HSG6]|nr:Stp1/IreP family PP2C-type Ser/Thr phosphatase [Anaerolineales bacterium HSG6]
MDGISGIPDGTVLLISITAVVVSIVGLVVVFKVMPNRRKDTQSSASSSPQFHSTVDDNASTEEMMPIPPKQTDFDEDTARLSTTRPPKQRRNSDHARTQPNVMRIQETMKAQKGAAIPTQPKSDSNQLPNMNWQAIGMSDVGLKRELNEDSWGKAELLLSNDTPCGLYIVADGMGGHEGGEIASSVTVQTITSQFYDTPPAPGEGALESWLESVTNTANEAVIKKQVDQKRPEKMGSTLVMTLVSEGKAHIANVGDSRAYLLNNAIAKITADHSLVERLVELGQITPAEARTHPQRNVIYSTMGDPEKMQVDIYNQPLQPGERLLLCSDGLSGMIEDETILEISKKYPDPQQACTALIEAANEGGGKDNITAIVIQFDD